MKNNHIFILGGARSGKSKFAEDLALKEITNPKQKIAYIATAKTNDDKEMQSRIKKHVERRGASFITYEEDLALDEAIINCAKNHDIIMIDCLTIWLSNIGFAEKIDEKKNIKNLLLALEKTSNITIILVSNEVGLGIVPANKVAREFVDKAGELNQKIAKICNQVYFVTAGIPLKIKS